MDFIHTHHAKLYNFINSTNCYRAHRRHQPIFSRGNFYFFPKAISLQEEESPQSRNRSVDPESTENFQFKTI